MADEIKGDLNPPTCFVAVAWSLQSCPTLCDPMDCTLPGSSVHGIFKARILEWVAISSSRGSSHLPSIGKLPNSHLLGNPRLSPIPSVLISEALRSFITASHCPPCPYLKFPSAQLPTGIGSQGPHCFFPAILPSLC